jgi:uncharacterized membrane protein YphA (DoxX/SURF4 family)
MGSIKKISFILARFFLSAIFLLAGFAHIADFDGMESSLTNALYSIAEHSAGKVWIQRLVEELMPLVPLLSILALVCLVVGGILVLLGIKYKFGALLLIAFIVPVTLIMHHFYFLDGPIRQLEMANFWKNLAVLGGLILLTLHSEGSSLGYDEEG